jgi:tRNA-dihydrouridine synthase B
MRFRPMTYDDLTEVMTIERAAFESPWDPEFFIAEMEGPVSRAMVVERDQLIIGYATYRVIIDEAHLMNFAVAPGRHRQGVGRQLLDAVMAHTRTLGATYMFLEVRRSNLPAQALYRSVGFEQIDIRRRYYCDNHEDALIWKLDYPETVPSDWTMDEIILGNGLLFAPLAGIADASVRVLCRYFGAGPTMSEMVSAHGVSAKRTHLISEQLVLADLERPVTLQIVGSDPQVMAFVAGLAVAKGADAINLNFACPARKIVKGGKGCAMMQTPELAAAVMRAVRDAVSVPVTVKIRAGWNSGSINAVPFSQLAQECGMDAVILHPRTREQAFKGAADWSLIEQTVAAVSIPVVGNGDIKTPADARRMFEETGCAAIMVGRGALGRPWIFSQIRDELQGSGFLQEESHVVPDLDVPPLDVAALEAGDREQRKALIQLHVALASRVKPEWVVAREVRKHVLWYSRGMPDASQFRSTIHAANDIAAVLAMVESFF